MLEARTVALVGASPRPGSPGERMVAEAGRSPAAPRSYLVDPRYQQITGRPCYPSLADLPEPVDLVLLGVPDTALGPAGQQVRQRARGCTRTRVPGGAQDQPARHRP